jgi:hypothetical protein
MRVRCDGESMSCGGEVRRGAGEVDGVGAAQGVGAG